MRGYPEDVFTMAFNNARELSRASIIQPRQANTLATYMCTQSYSHTTKTRITSGAHCNNSGIYSPLYSRNCYPPRRHSPSETARNQQTYLSELITTLTNHQPTSTIFQTILATAPGIIATSAIAWNATKKLKAQSSTTFPNYDAIALPKR